MGQLSVWEVDWRFQNAKMPEHGRNGVISVTAKDKDDALEKAKRAVSMNMFRTPVYENYVVVDELVSLMAPIENEISKIAAQIYSGKDWHKLSSEERELVAMLERGGYTIPYNPPQGFVGKASVL